MMDFGYGMGWMWLFWLLRPRSGGAGRGRGPGGRWRCHRPDGGQQGPGARPGRSRARQLLDERYARGEITTEEYRERLRELAEDT